MVVRFRSNNNGSRPIDEGALYTERSAVLITGKDANRIEILVSSCMDQS